MRFGSACSPLMTSANVPRFATFIPLLVSHGIEQLGMFAPWTFLVWLHATLGTVPLAALVVFGFYALYVVKVRLGIDIFPGTGGLHLPGPRTLVKMIARLLDP